MYIIYICIKSIECFLKKKHIDGNTDYIVVIYEMVLLLV